MRTCTGGCALCISRGARWPRAQVQTIGFLSHLRSKGVHRPFMVVGPLSTLPNWVSEFARWCPSMPCILYHGSKPERTALRSKRMPTGAPRRRRASCYALEPAISPQAIVKHRCENRRDNRSRCLHASAQGQPAQPAAPTLLSAHPSLPYAAQAR